MHTKRLNMEQHTQAALKAGGATIPAIAPGAVTALASWLDVINNLLSAVLFALSIAFLLWRWRAAYVDRTENEDD